MAPNTPANSGAARAMATAATVINWPPTGTLTCSERTRSLSEPATTITPQPMAKLPASKAQRSDAPGVPAFNEAP